MEDIRWPTTITSPKTVVTKPKQKDRLHQWLLPPKPPQVALYLQECCLHNCQWSLLSVSPILDALGLSASLFMPIGPTFQRQTNKTLVWLAETRTDTWQYEFKWIFPLFLSGYFMAEKKEASGNYWVLLLKVFTFKGDIDSWLLILGIWSLVLQWTNLKLSAVVLQSLYLIFLPHHLFNTLTLISYIAVNKKKMARNSFSKFMKLFSSCYFNFFPFSFFFLIFASSFTCLSNALHSNFFEF